VRLPPDPLDLRDVRRRVDAVLQEFLDHQALPGRPGPRVQEKSSSGPEGRASSRCAAVDGLPGTGPWVTRPVRGPKGPVAQVPPGLPVETSRRTDEPGATGSAPPRG